MLLGRGVAAVVVVRGRGAWCGAGVGVGGMRCGRAVVLRWWLDGVRVVLVVSIFLPHMFVESP